MTVDETPDAELVRQFKAGSRPAFDRFLRRHQDRIYRLACVSLDDPQQAADAAQETFLRAFSGLGRFRFGAAPFTWLYRTAKNVCREFNRKRHPQALGGELDDQHDGAAVPDRQVADADCAARVRALVAGLPERQREVVLLRIFEELSVADTAAAMGCRPGTVKALLHKATQRLKIDVEDSGLDL